jgi:outer membrane lipopolysaccharide assembly protein LptE/RlpB
MPRLISALTLLALAAVLLAVIPAGCGYSMRKGPAVKAVRLGRIVNNTYEPRLQDFLYEALSLELMKNGIRIDPGAGHQITGSIDEVRLRGTAEKNGVTVQYEVTVTGSFFLVDPGDGKRPLRKSSAFIVSFGGEGALERLLAGKELALKRALANMSQEIVASIIHQR